LINNKVNSVIISYTGRQTASNLVNDYNKYYQTIYPDQIYV
jgi:hypothetical protein